MLYVLILAIAVMRRPERTWQLARTRERVRKRDDNTTRIDIRGTLAVVALFRACSPSRVSAATTSSAGVWRCFSYGCVVSVEVWGLLWGSSAPIHQRWAGDRTTWSRHDPLRSMCSRTP